MMSKCNDDNENDEENKIQYRLIDESSKLLFFVSLVLTWRIYVHVTWDAGKIVWIFSSEKFPVNVSKWHSNDRWIQIFQENRWRKKLITPNSCNIYCGNGEKLWLPLFIRKWIYFFMFLFYEHWISPSCLYVCAS